MSEQSITSQLQQAYNRECPEFTATQEELVVLYRHWYFVLLDCRQFHATNGCADSRLRDDTYQAKVRLDKITEILGSELAEYLSKECENDFHTDRATDLDDGYSLTR